MGKRYNQIFNFEAAFLIYEGELKKTSVEPEEIWVVMGARPRGEGEQSKLLGNSEDSLNGVISLGSLEMVVRINIVIIIGNKS